MIEIIYANWCSFLQITAKYFHCSDNLLLLVISLTSLLLRLQPITFIFHGSNGFITAPLLPNRPQLLQLSFHYYPLLPKFAVVWIYYCIITTALLLNYVMDVYYFPLLPHFTVVMDQQVIINYYIITASLLHTVKHYFHNYPLLPYHEISFLLSVFSLFPIKVLGSNEVIHSFTPTPPPPNLELSLSGWPELTGSNCICDYVRKQPLTVAALRSGTWLPGLS